MLQIANTTVISPPNVRREQTVTVKDGRIQAVVPSSAAQLLEQASLLDGRSLVLVPGFIDLQVNGGFGHDFTSNPSSIWKVALDLPKMGVTSFLPTIVTSPLETVDAARQAMTSDPGKGFAGAVPLGLHLEGPFLNPAKKGAHNPSYLRQPKLDDVVDWSPQTGVAMTTLAPELPGAIWIGSMLAERGILVSAGHSTATYAQAREAFAADFRYCTHLFNAMGPLHHRQPGLAGAALSDERVVIGIIADGLHVHPALIKAIWQIAQDGRLNLVSDAIAALGQPPGRYQLGDKTVHVSEEGCRLADGTLAGSTLSLDTAVRNLIAYAGCSLSDAVRTVSSTPAALLGLGHRKGRVEAGYDADLVLLSSDLEVVTTIAAGQVVFNRDS